MSKRGRRTGNPAHTNRRNDQVPTHDADNAAHGNDVDAAHANRRSDRPGVRRDHRINNDTDVVCDHTDDSRTDKQQ